MKRKHMVTVIGMAVMVLFLSACGGVQGGSNDVTEKQIEASTTQNNEESAEKRENAGKEEKAETKEMDKAISIEETILVEKEDFKITATELDYTDYSVDLKVIIENASDQELSFSSGTVGYAGNAINGYMVSDGYLYVDVPAGKKANETISFSTDALAIYGITELADIKIGIKVDNSDNEELYKDVAQVKTSIADSYDYSLDTYQKSITSGILESVYDCSIDYFAEDELYNQGNIRIISEALMINRDGEKILLLEVVNDSSDDIYGCLADISLNGLAVRSGTWSNEAINPGTRCIMDLSLSSLFKADYWDTFGITEIGEIAFSFIVDDEDYNEIIAPQELHVVLSDTTAALDDSGEELYQGDGIRIISKGIVKDPSDYSDDVHMLFLVENTSSSDVYVDLSYGSLSINGFMTDEITYKTGIAAGGKGAVIVEVSGSSLEDNGITGMDEIEEAEVTFEVTNGRYDIIAKPTVTVKI